MRAVFSGRQFSVGGSFSERQFDDGEPNETQGILIRSVKMQRSWTKCKIFTWPIRSKRFLHSGQSNAKGSVFVLCECKYLAFRTVESKRFDRGRRDAKSLAFKAIKRKNFSICGSHVQNIFDSRSLCACVGLCADSLCALWFVTLSNS
jgi:hypothetical protein